MQLTDVVHRSGAELRKENLDSEELQVLDDEGPEVEDVVPRDVGSLLHDDGRAAEQLTLDGGSEAARAAADDTNLLDRSNFKLRSR